MLRLQKLSASCSSCGEHGGALPQHGRLRCLPNRLERHQNPRHKAWLQCQAKQGSQKGKSQS